MELVLGLWVREVVEVVGTVSPVMLPGLVQEEEVEVQCKLVRAAMPQLLVEAVGEGFVLSARALCSFYQDYVEEAVAVVPMLERRRLLVLAEIV